MFTYLNHGYSPDISLLIDWYSIPKNINHKLLVSWLFRDDLTVTKTIADSAQSQSSCMHSSLNLFQRFILLQVDELRDSVQRLNAHLERVTKEKDDFKTERDTALTKCDTLQRDMTAGDHAKSQALEVTNVTDQSALASGVTLIMNMFSNEKQLQTSNMLSRHLVTFRKCFLCFSLPR